MLPDRWGGETLIQLKDELEDIRHELNDAESNLQGHLSMIQKWANDAVDRLEDELPTTHLLAEEERDLKPILRWVAELRKRELDKLVEIGRHVASMGE